MRRPFGRKPLGPPAEADVPEQYREDSSINYAGAILKQLTIYYVVLLICVFSIFVPYVLFGPTAFTQTSGISVGIATGSGDIALIFGVINLVRGIEKKKDLEVAACKFGKWTLRLPKYPALKRIYFHKIFEIHPLPGTMLEQVYQTLARLSEDQRKKLLVIEKIPSEDKLRYKLAKGVYPHLFKLVDHHGNPPKKGLTDMIYLSRCATAGDLYDLRNDTAIYLGWEREVQAEDWDWTDLNDDLRITWPHSGKTSVMPICVAAGDSYTTKESIETLVAKTSVGKETIKAVVENAGGFLAQNLANVVVEQQEDIENLEKGVQRKTKGAMLYGAKLAGAAEGAMPELGVRLSGYGKKHLVAVALAIILVAAVFYYLTILPKPHP